MARLDPLFDQLIARQGSDLHVAVGRPPKIRAMNALHPLEGFPPPGEDDLRAALEEICPPGRWKRFEAEGDADFAYSYGDRARLRVNYYRRMGGFGAVFRIIPSTIFSLQSLNAPPVLATFGNYTSGLCFITGPKGCGKSTTVAAIVDGINAAQRRFILTLEDPIEFLYTPKQSVIVQREVGVDAPSFAEGLRAAIREGADVIVVGEIPDRETMTLAMQAAEAGILTFATVQTNSAIKTIDRIVDLFPQEYQMAAREALAVGLRAVCTQLLVQRSDGAARIAVHEVLLQTRAVANMIREGKTPQLAQVMLSSKSMGMQLLDDQLDRLLREGLITGEEAYYNAYDKDRFARYASGAGAGEASL